MQPFQTHAPSRPLFPTPLSLPLRIIPATVHARLLSYSLNGLFRDELEEGELDFLTDRIVRIVIEDTGVEYRLTIHNGSFQPGNNMQAPDLALNGTLYDYMLLASRREDADTLFFRRNLQIRGDTDLGLNLKNFLDGVDLETRFLPGHLQSLLQKSLPWYEQLFGRI